MFDKNDYIARINRARRKRNRNDYKMYALVTVAVVLVVAGVVIVGTKIKKQASGEPSIVQTQSTGETAEVNVDETETTESVEEAEARKLEAEKDSVIAAYQSLGLVKVEGYLNVRKNPSTDGDIIGKLEGNSACEILGTEGEWHHISSGGIEGYISNQFVLSGEEAKTAAREQIKQYAIVQAEKLNIREDANTQANVMGQALKQERYELLGEVEGWVQIPTGYLSKEYVEIRYALNEARKLDLRAMALNQYDNLVISKVTGYLNVRKEPKEDGNSNVIGKLPSKAAGEIVERLDGWYKIKSGNITGYITADSQYTATGIEANDLALESANLMAIVNTDKLNVRSEPSTDSAIWTQLSKEERYPVAKQMDGWVQIELDSGEENADAAYISTRENNVEVRYALNEAIKFSPLEEKANKEASLRTQIVNYALQFVGNPYVWGGVSLTKGADCSGFTLSVLKKYGIGLPHYSGSQAQMGKAVKSSEMRPGDLIFYTDKRGTINHVSMYIGNGQIVHAASRRSGIKISTWNYRTPYKIRNVID